MVAPAYFEAFAAGRDLAAATIRNPVFRLSAPTARASAASRPDTGSIPPR